MASIWLAILYIAFISLGLPNAILDSARPSMYPALPYYLLLFTVLMFSMVELSNMLAYINI